MSKYEEIAGIIRTRISDGTYPIEMIAFCWHRFMIIFGTLCILNLLDLIVISLLKNLINTIKTI